MAKLLLLSDCHQLRQYLVLVGILSYVSCKHTEPQRAFADSDQDPPTFSMLHRKKLARDLLLHFDWIGVLLYSAGLIIFIFGLNWVSTTQQGVTTCSAYQR